MNIIQSPSPNFSKSNYKKFGVQIHKTLGLMPGTLEWLRNPRSDVSCHYLITKKGEIYQLVDLKDRSWTSGKIARPTERAKKIMLRTPWGSYVRPDHYLVQLEVECLLTETYTEEQFEAIVWLCHEHLPFQVEDKSFITHQDTLYYKPDLEEERAEILRRLSDRRAGDNSVNKMAIKEQLHKLIDLL